MNDDPVRNTAELDVSTESMQEKVIYRGESMLKPIALQEHLVGIVRALISIYNNPWRRRDLRERAASIVAQLGARHPVVLELVIEDAETYAAALEGEDYDATSPNSFDILAQVRPPNDRVVSFLRGVARRESSLSASCPARDALSRLSDVLAMAS